MRRSLLTPLCLLILMPAALQADASQNWSENRGVSIGLQFNTNVIGAEDPSTTAPDGVFVEEVGHGAMLHVGYTFTPSFALRLSFGGAAHETTFQATEVVHATGVLEAHYRFLPKERARPYLLGGLGGTTLAFGAGDLESEVNGTIAVLGGGFLYNLTQHLLLDLAVRLDLINWQEITVRQKVGDGEVELTGPVDDTGSSARFLFGLAWQF